MNEFKRRELKEVYKLICITHPIDLYDFLADNNAEPYTEPLLTHDKLINLTFDYALENGTDSFYEFHAQMENY